jgi:teichoic acid transport system ATP-binding protein
MRPKIKLTNVSKKYSLFKKKSDKLLDIFSLNNKPKSFYALRNISFEVFEGETIGVIGINGSGKSTLSHLLSQVTSPTSGEIEINGNISLVAISGGLNNHLTGLENIELKCLMHGMDKRDIEEVTPKIIEFADLGDFIHQPIKSYSSGMKSRLGFAISVHLNPDILIVDEALSVGDQTFYDKCINKFNEFKQQGKTMFFISHSLSQIRSIADRVLWLNFGQIQEFGATEEVLTKYQDFIKWYKHLSETEKNAYRKQLLKEQMTAEAAHDSEKELSRTRKNLKRTMKKYKRTRAFIRSLELIVLLACFFLSVSLLF